MLKISDLDLSFIGLSPDRFCWSYRDPKSPIAVNWNSKAGRWLMQGKQGNQEHTDLGFRRKWNQAGRTMSIQNWFSLLGTDHFLKTWLDAMHQSMFLNVLVLILILKSWIFLSFHHKWICPFFIYLCINCVLYINLEKKINCTCMLWTWYYYFLNTLSIMIKLKAKHPLKLFLL